MNISAARYTRAFAWAKLVKFWSSSRSDDLLGLVRSAFTLAAGGCVAYYSVQKQAGLEKR